MAEEQRDEAYLEMYSQLYYLHGRVLNFLNFFPVMHGEFLLE